MPKNINTRARGVICYYACEGIKMIGDVLIYGILLGWMYSLMALSLTLIWGIGRIWDFAQAGIYSTGAVLTWFLFRGVGIDLIIAIFISIALCAFISVGVEKIVYKRMRGKHRERLILAFGVYLVIENTLLAIFSPKIKILTFPYQTLTFNIAGTYISFYRSLLILVSCLTFLAIHMFLKFTKAGKAMRAVAQNPIGAELSGINVDRIFSLTFAICGSLSGMTGILLAPIFAIYPAMGLMPIVKATIVIVLGGLGSIKGALIGGLALGIMESFGGMFISTAYVNAFALIVLVIILVFRPYGIFGKEER